MMKLNKTPNLTELTYRSIKQNVLNGTFNELARLTEESLAKQLGISKSPVREALNRLEAEGLITIEARRGAYIRQFSAKQVSDLYDMRILLETHSIEIAQVTSELLERMAESIELTKKHLGNNDKLAHIEEDLRFHGMITEATGNQELYRVLENMQQKSLLCRSKSFRLSASTSPVAHAKILDALKDGDRVAAQEAMREHIAFVRTQLMDSLAATNGHL